MSDYLFVPFHPGHWTAIDIREHEANIMSFEAMVKATSVADTFSLVTPTGLVLAIVGYYELWEGVAEVFLIPSTCVPHYAKTFLKGVHRAIEEIGKRDFHRLQTSSRADDQTDRWMEHIGFTCEGTMVAYTKDKEDYRMWAIVLG